MSTSNAEIVAEIARNLKNNKSGYVFLIGSGLSSAAGIPTAYKISIDLIKEKYLSLNGKRLEKDLDYERWYCEETGSNNISYSDVFDWVYSRSPDKRIHLRDLIGPFQDKDREYNKRARNAHKSIAKIVKDNFVKIIITTNFDRLLEINLGEYNIYCSTIIDDRNLLGQKPFIADWPFRNLTLFKVSGDYLNTEIKNTSEELSVLPPDIIKVLKDVFSSFGLIICGWSSTYDLALKEIIKDSYSINKAYKNYWIDKHPLQGESKQLCEILGFQPVEIDGNTFFMELEESLKRIDTEDSKIEPAKRPESDSEKKDISKFEILEVEVTANHNAAKHKLAEYRIDFSYICNNEDRTIEYIEVDFKPNKKSSLAYDLRRFTRITNNEVLLYPGYYTYGYGGVSASKIDFISNNRIRIFFSKGIKIEKTGRLILLFTTNCHLINTSKSGFYQVSVNVNNTKNAILSIPFEIRDTIHFVENNAVLIKDNTNNVNTDISLNLMNDKYQLIRDVDTLTIAFPHGAFVIPEKLKQNNIYVSKNNRIQHFMMKLGLKYQAKWHKVKSHPTQTYGSWLTVVTPITINKYERFSIHFSKDLGITNPSQSGYYTIQAKTSAQNWFTVSPPFTIS